MEKSDAQSQPGNIEIEANMMENFMRSLEVVQTIFDQNTVLISEISRNHKENAGQGGLTRNIDLIRELNSNMGHVLQLYADISAEFIKSTKEDNSNLPKDGSVSMAASVRNQNLPAEPTNCSNNE